MSILAGIYKVCFSNEFSTFSHKLVYMELNVGPEQPLPGVGEHATVLTQVIHVLWTQHSRKIHLLIIYSQQKNTYTMINQYGKRKKNMYIQPYLLKT